MNEELKPCPFCGGRAELTNDAADHPQARDIYFVACRKCGVSTDTSHEAPEAVATWNPRAALSAQPQGVAVMYVRYDGENISGMRLPLAMRLADDKEGWIPLYAAAPAAAARIAELEAQLAESREREVMNNLLQFGHGKLVVKVGTYKGQPAVFLAPAKMPGKVGEDASRELQPNNRLVPGEVVLTFPTDAQAETVYAALFPATDATIKCPHDEQVHMGTWPEGMPADHIPQVQGNMMVTGRQWLDFISYDPAIDTTKYPDTKSACVRAVRVQKGQK